MSDLLALAAVTAILKRSLENALVAHNLPSHVGGDVLVSALPPDRVGAGAEERAQLNIFLYSVTPHTRLRRAEGGAGSRRSLTLDLHYLISAYGTLDFQIDLLLGYALAVLQSRPSLGREEIRGVLRSFEATGAAADSPAAALAASRLAEGVEGLEISPQFLPVEELTRLWSAFQSRFRPSLAYKVSAVVFAEDSQRDP